MAQPWLYYSPPNPDKSTIKLGKKKNLLKHPGVSGMKPTQSQWKILDLDCTYFIENFCIYVHKRDWSVNLFLCWVFMCLGIGLTVTPYIELDITSFSIL